MSEAIYVCRDCYQYLVNRDLHYVRDQSWRYDTIEDVGVRLDTIINGNLTGNWRDGSAEGHRDKQTDDECPNCGRTDFAFRISMIATEDERTNERSAESIASWYVIPQPPEAGD